MPLEKVSYVCLDPADESVFSFIIRSDDTISSKGLRLHAFVTHPQIVSSGLTSEKALRYIHFVLTGYPIQPFYMGTV